MILFREPSEETVAKFLATQAARDFTYTAVGATATTPPRGFAVDHTRTQLGQGEAVFVKAKAALCRWEQFRLGWVEARSARATIEPGDPVAVIARMGPLRWLNACRVIYVIDEENPIRRFGFAYGTLPDHAAIGEERFLVEWNPADDVVWYDIFAFSRPRGFLSRAGYPAMRQTQKRFRQESAAAMRLAVQERLAA